MVQDIFTIAIMWSSYDIISYLRNELYISIASIRNPNGRLLIEYPIMTGDMRMTTLFVI